MPRGIVPPHVVWWCTAGESRRGRDRRHHTAWVLRKRQVEIDESTYTGPERDRLTVRELLDSVVLHYEMREHHSLRTVKGHVAVWKRALGARWALDVTTGRLQQFMQTWRRDGLTPATINRRLAILRRAYRLGKVRLDPARLDFTDLFLP